MIKFALIFVALFIFIIGWDAAWSFLGVKPMTPWRLKANLEDWKKKGLLIDVRTSGEFRFFHIDGAMHFPGVFFDPGAFDSIDRETPLILICMTGHRSPVVAYILSKRGFKEVYNLTWGMVAWKLCGGPTV